MATPPNRNTANTNAQTALDALQSAADASFVSDAGDAILQAIALGHFLVTLTTDKNCNLQVIHDYFVALGYAVAYPGLGMKAGPQPFQPDGLFQPADLFGVFWFQYWQNHVPNLHNPCRITLSWRTP